MTDRGWMLRPLKSMGDVPVVLESTRDVPVVLESRRDVPVVLESRRDVSVVLQEGSNDRVALVDMGDIRGHGHGYRISSKDDIEGSYTRDERLKNSGYKGLVER